MAQSSSRSQTPITDESVGATQLLAAIEQLNDLMKEQTTLLAAMNKQHAEASGMHKEPIYPASVPSRSTSAWNPLLRSFNNNILPALEKWRRSLDTLLIFVGLFSAIITAFFVDSLKTLKPDENARTNELLANLTEIVVAISQGSLATTRIASPSVFAPDANDVRFNVYCSLSLILSIATAALAVAGHAFLSSLGHAHGDSVTQLTEKYQRWMSAKRFLRPGIEALPQILTIPVILFAIGLLDNLFSSATHLPAISGGVLAAAILSGTCLAAMGLVMLYALLHGILIPTSPFQTTLLASLVHGLGFKHLASGGSESNSKKLTIANCEVFHQVMQETFDDQLLDQASVAVSGVMVEYFRLRSSFLSFAELSKLELHTLLHLLSPEASYKSNVVAASVIGDSGVLYYYWDSNHNRAGVNPEQRALLLQALIGASKHAASRVSHKIDWLLKSPFVKAMAFLIHYPEMQDENAHVLFKVIGANYFKEVPSSKLVYAHGAAATHALELLADMLKQKLNYPDQLSRCSDHTIDDGLLALLGPCSIDHQQVCELVMSFIYRPDPGHGGFISRFAQSSWSFYDYEAVIGGLIRWLSSYAVANTISDFLTEGPINSFITMSQIQPFKGHNLLYIIVNSVQNLSLQNLMSCVHFINKICGTEIWNNGEQHTLSLISRFLELLEWGLHLWLQDHKQKKLVIQALTQVHNWTQYTLAGNESKLSQPANVSAWFLLDNSLAEKIENAWRAIHESSNLEDSVSDEVLEVEDIETNKERYSFAKAVNCTVYGYGQMWHGQMTS